MLRLSPAGNKPIVVISDTHFGELGATLSNSRSHTRGAAAPELLDHLMDALASLGPLDEIVLLGDIWEMWSAGFAQAQVAAAPFLERLCTLPCDQITFVPGNHDYHLLVQHIEEAQVEALRRGEIPPRRYRAQHCFTDSFLAGLLPAAARDRLTVRYPDHTRMVGGRRILFHHGHHLATLRGGDLFAAFPMFILKRLEGVGVPTLTREELERGVSIFYEMMYAVSLGDRASGRLYAWWERWQMWKRWWLWSVLGWVRQRLRRASSVRERGTPQVDIERFHDAARWLLHMMAAECDEAFEPPDVLVFGHTHRSGVASLALDDGDKLHLVNAGCWFVEGSKPNSAHVNTLAVLDSSHAGVYRLSSTGLELRESVRFSSPVREPVWQ